ncbi:MAG: protein kinase [Bdellovibrionota bacterium]
MEPTSSNPGSGATDPLIGTIFGGKYTVKEKVGAGGMGGVYRAEHQLMNRVVALKVLRSNFATDSTLLKRFHHEAKAASQISHPNAVTLFDYGVENDVPYLVMEFIDGRTLKSLIAAESPLPIPRVKEILRQICAALYEAHKIGLVHRDIKPDNFMIRKNDRGEDVVKVLDFGVSKSIGLTDFNTDSQLTQEGTIIGTPQYIAPEQCQGKELDTRCDIYSLGAVVYEMLSGEAPFRAPTVLELLVKVLHHDAEPLRKLRPDLNFPPEIDRVVMKCLSKKPEERFSTVTELYEAFAAAVPEPLPPKKFPLALVGGGGIALALLLGAAMVLSHNRPADSGEEAARVRALSEAVEKAEKAKKDALERVEKLRAEADQLLKQNEVEKAQAIKKQQEAAEAAEMDKETALWQAQVAKENADKALAELKKKQAVGDQQLRVQQEAAKKAELEKQAALQQAEAVRLESERKAEEIRKAEEQKALALKEQAERDKAEALKKAEAEKAELLRQQQELAKKAEADKEAALREQEELAKKAEKEKEEALKQAEAAKAELARLAAAAKKAEQDKAEMMRKMSEAKAQQPNNTPPADKQKTAAKDAAEQARLSEAVRLANEQKADAMRKVEEMKREASRQAAAAKRAADEAERIRQQAAERAREQAAKPTPTAAENSPSSGEQGGEAAPVKRRRCGPTWCL